ncbi:hypothetical protein ColTof4_05902 [Colletotrichum tofieldiae]|nr:hypothetical protein ColTof3_01077 [Colletotrichum tofieldiae]GKT73479.1 hypothetical protein ColTof4_05902 [Colletotrichum tofieldiae]
MNEPVRAFPCPSLCGRRARGRLDNRHLEQQPVEPRALARAPELLQLAPQQLRAGGARPGQRRRAEEDARAHGVDLRVRGPAEGPVDDVSVGGGEAQEGVEAGGRPLRQGHGGGGRGRGRGRAGGGEDALEDGGPAGRLADLVDEEVLLLDREEGVVEAQGVGELCPGGLPRVPSARGRGGLGLDVTREAGGQEGVERGGVAVGARDVGQQPRGGVQGREGPREDVLGGDGGQVADLVVVVVEGVVEGDQGGEVDRFGVGGGEGAGGGEEGGEGGRRGDAGVEGARVEEGGGHHPAPAAEGLCGGRGGGGDEGRHHGPAGADDSVGEVGVHRLGDEIPPEPGELLRGREVPGGLCAVRGGEDEVEDLCEVVEGRGAGVRVRHGEGQVGVQRGVGCRRLRGETRVVDRGEGVEGRDCGLDAGRARRQEDLAEGRRGGGAGGGLRRVDCGDGELRAEKGALRGLGDGLGGGGVRGGLGGRVGEGEEGDEVPDFEVGGADVGAALEGLGVAGLDVAEDLGQARDGGRQLLRGDVREPLEDGLDGQQRAVDVVVPARGRGGQRVVDDGRGGGDPVVVLEQERAQRAGGHLADVPDGAGQVAGDEAVELVARGVGRARAPDDVERREHGLGGDGAAEGGGLHDLAAGAEEVQEHAGENGVLVVLQAGRLAVPAGFEGGFALVCAEEVVEERAQEEEAAVADAPAGRMSGRGARGKRGRGAGLHFRLETAGRELEALRDVRRGFAELGDEGALEDVLETVEGVDLGQLGAVRLGVVGGFLRDRHELLDDLVEGGLGGVGGDDARDHGRDTGGASRGGGLGEDALLGSLHRSEHLM